MPVLRLRPVQVREGRTEAMQAETEADVLQAETETHWPAVPGEAMSDSYNPRCRLPRGPAFRPHTTLRNLLAPAHFQYAGRTYLRTTGYGDGNAIDLETGGAVRFDESIPVFPLPGPAVECGAD
jgi:hypothetical protein